MIHNHERKKDRGAHRDVHQETTRIESAYGDESGGDREVHDHPHRPAGGAAAAMRALPSAMPGGPQRAPGAGAAGIFPFATYQVYGGKRAAQPPYESMR